MNRDTKGFDDSAAASFRSETTQSSYPCQTDVRGEEQIHVDQYELDSSRYPAFDHASSSSSETEDHGGWNVSCTSLLDDGRPPTNDRDLQQWFQSDKNSSHLWELKYKHLKGLYDEQTEVVNHLQTDLEAAEARVNEGVGQYRHLQAVHRNLQKEFKFLHDDNEKLYQACVNSKATLKSQDKKIEGLNAQLKILMELGSINKKGAKSAPASPSHSRSGSFTSSSRRSRSGSFTNSIPLLDVTALNLDDTAETAAMSASNTTMADNSNEGRKNSSKGDGKLLGSLFSGKRDQKASGTKKQQVRHSRFSMPMLGSGEDMNERQGNPKSGTENGDIARAKQARHMRRRRPTSRKSVG